MAARIRKLRSGYTTGACAAAAAKAATILLLRNAALRQAQDDTGDQKALGDNFAVRPSNCELRNPCLLAGRSNSELASVEIPFPDGTRVAFPVHHPELIQYGSGYAASASVIKDAGDDPDVTNGAEIVATVAFSDEPETRRHVDEALRQAQGDNITANSSLVTRRLSLMIEGGEGVGRVTKPGLSVPIGEPAINPVPRKMITEAVMEAITEHSNSKLETRNSKPQTANPKLVVTISVPNGEELAKRTLNSRLGISGGISILGTTGIVRPLSSEAWTASIAAAMDVAKALGREEIVLSTGRVSEKAHMQKYGLPEDAYVMMGDYLEFSLVAAKDHEFRRIHLSAQWAKMVKVSMATPQTHVRHGALDPKKAVEHLNRLGIAIPATRDFNTAREIYDFIVSTYGTSLEPLRRVSIAAREYAEVITDGIPVVTHLVSPQGDIIVDSER